MSLFVFAFFLLFSADLLPLFVFLLRIFMNFYEKILKSVVFEGE